MTTTFRCPKCETETLIEMKTPDHVVLDFCENCNGLWFDESELADYLGLSKDLVEMESVRHRATATDLVCPKCAGHLVEMPFSTQADLLIDYCGSCHGTFFDFREVAVAQAVAADLEPADERLRLIKSRFFQKGFG